MSPTAVLSQELEQLCIKYICSLAREGEFRLYLEPKVFLPGRTQASSRLQWKLQFKNYVMVITSIVNLGYA